MRSARRSPPLAVPLSENCFAPVRRGSGCFRRTSASPCCTASTSRDCACTCHACTARCASPVGSCSRSQSSASTPRRFRAGPRPADPWPRETILNRRRSGSADPPVFLGQTHLLEQKLWHPGSPSPEEMLPLWARSSRATPRNSSATGGASRACRCKRRAAKTARERRNALAAMPRTLAHNDFNPRNLAFRPNGAAPRPCASTEGSSPPFACRSTISPSCCASSCPRRRSAPPSSNIWSCSARGWNRTRVRR